MPLEQLRPLVDGVVAGVSGFEKFASASGGLAVVHPSPCSFVSHGLEWRLQVQATPVASDAAAAPAAATRPVQLGLFIMNSVRFAVPRPPAACTLTGLSFRLEAARVHGEGQPAVAAAAAPGAGGLPAGADAAAAGAAAQPAGEAAGPEPRKMEMKVTDKVPHNSGLGWPAFFAALATGSVDDPALAPFVHAGPGGAKVLRLRGEVLGLE